MAAHRPLFLSSTAFFRFKMSAMSLQLCIFSLPRKQVCAALSSTAVRSISSRDVQVIQNSETASLKRGTGGRSSFSGVVATVFGASGFLGRYVVNKLGKIGCQVIIPYRGDHYDVRHLKPAGDLGQVLFQPFHLRDPASIRQAVKYSNVVINLIGREWETKNFKFDDVHDTGAWEIARACRDMGVERLLHVSALNSTLTPGTFVMKTPSNFFPSKKRGEDKVLNEFPDATIIRPSDIYGQEDRFLRYYTWATRRQYRSLPLWKKGEQTFKQPVFCSDVAQGIVNAIKDPMTKAKIYQAVGPKRYQLSELVDWIYRVLRRDVDWGYKRTDLKWDPIFLMKVRFVEAIMPDRPLQYVFMERVEREFVSDNVDPSLPTLEDLGVNLMDMEHQVPWELKPYRAYNYYNDELGEFPDPIPPKTV